MGYDVVRLVHSYAYGHPFLETQNLLINSINSSKGDVHRIVSWSKALFEEAFANETVTGYKDGTSYSYLKELVTMVRKLKFKKDD